MVKSSLAAVIVGVGALGCGADAGPRYTVAGQIEGIWDGAPVQLRLEHGADADVIALDRDGAFAFTTPLAAGDAYLVTVANGEPCDVARGMGTVDDDVTDVTVRCGAPVDVRVDARPDWRFDPVPTASVVGLSVLAQRVRVTVTAPAALAIDVGGRAVVSGEPVELTLGATQEVPIAFTGGGRSRTYRLGLHRGELPIEVAGHVTAEQPPVPGLPVMFGAGLATDGDAVIAGAPWLDGSDTADSGGVRVLAAAGGGWTGGAWLTLAPPRSYAEFGAAVAVDGDVLVVGAPIDRGLNDLVTGRAYVFRRGPLGWSLEAALQASEPGFDDKFGATVAVRDGTVLVGAPFEDSAALDLDGNAADDSATDAGAVYEFREVAPGDWRQTAYVKAPVPTQGFGGAVALEGDHAIIGAGRSGRAFAFHRTGTTWQPGVELMPAVRGPSSAFGARVALSGSRAAVSDVYDSGAGSGVDGDTAQTGPASGGAVHVYRLDGTGWQREAYVKATHPESSYFGQGLALLGDVLVVGAPQAAGGRGGLDVYHRGAAGWVADGAVPITVASDVANAGTTVALSWRGVAVAAPRDAAGGAVTLLR